jgi:hypothetical protein
MLHHHSKLLKTQLTFSRNVNKKAEHPQGCPAHFALGLGPRARCAHSEASSCSSFLLSHRFCEKPVPTFSRDALDVIGALAVFSDIEALFLIIDAGFQANRVFDQSEDDGRSYA